MIIMGIDPGSRITGFGIVSLNSKGVVQHINHGVISMKPTDAFPLRMKELGEGMQTILEKYKPEQVVIEKIFLGKNADSAFKLGHARGVALYEAAKHGAQVIEYATRVIKKGITGNGAASKESVQSCLQRLLNIKAIARIDASDALAMATFQAFHLMNPLHRRGLSGQALEL
jgi:crossover junction endodeoxyribonuclease RuvC